MDTVHEEALAAAGVRADGTIDINAALRSLLEGLLNAVMDEQASELGVPRNGYRERSLDTVSVNLFFTSFAKQARRSRKGGFTGCANVFSPIPVTAWRGRPSAGPSACRTCRLS